MESTQVIANKNMSWIEVYDNVLSEDYCKDLVERIDKDPRLTYVTDHKTYNLQQLILWGLDDWNDTNDFLTKKFLELAQAYYDKYMPLWPEDFLAESIKFKKYSANQGEYFKEHVDVDDNRSCVRFLTSLWFLNKVEKGGETVFTDHRISIEPRVGRVILFPPLWTHPHYSNPGSTDKFIFTQYLHYKSMKAEPLV
jgi:hypothetical protein